MCLRDENFPLYKCDACDNKNHPTTSRCRIFGKHFPPTMRLSLRWLLFSSFPMVSDTGSHVCGKTGSSICPGPALTPNDHHTDRSASHPFGMSVVYSYGNMFYCVHGR
jgi:hypothetical protein